MVGVNRIFVHIFLFLQPVLLACVYYTVVERMQQCEKQKKAYYNLVVIAFIFLIYFVDYLSIVIIGSRSMLTPFVIMFIVGHNEDVLSWKVMSNDDARNCTCLFMFFWFAFIIGYGFILHSLGYSLDAILPYSIER